MPSKLFWFGGILFSLWIVYDIYKNRGANGVSIYGAFWVAFALFTRYLMTK